jgi:hypothetical protein
MGGDDGESELRLCVGGEGGAVWRVVEHPHCIRQQNKPATSSAEQTDVGWWDEEENDDNDDNDEDDDDGEEGKAEGKEGREGREGRYCIHG